MLTHLLVIICFTQIFQVMVMKFVSLGLITISLSFLIETIFPTLKSNYYQVLPHFDTTLLFSFFFYVS